MAPVLFYRGMKITKNIENLQFCYEPLFGAIGFPKQQAVQDVSSLKYLKWPPNWNGFFDLTMNKFYRDFAPILCAKFNFNPSKVLVVTVKHTQHKFFSLFLYKRVLLVRFSRSSNYILLKQNEFAVHLLHFRHTTHDLLDIRESLYEDIRFQNAYLTRKK